MLVNIRLKKIHPNKQMYCGPGLVETAWKTLDVPDMYLKTIECKSWMEWKKTRNKSESSISFCVKQVAKIDNALDLEKLSIEEIQGKNRKTVLDAIDERAKELSNGRFKSS